MHNQINRVRYFYINKYVASRLSEKRYRLSYDFKHRALWFRTSKVAGRTIDHHFRQATASGAYLYGSEVAYWPWMYRNFFKFAFVRDPLDRLLSAWKDKVLRHNYFDFSAPEHERMQILDHFLTWLEDLDIDRCDQHLRAQWTLIDLHHIDFLGRFESFARDFGLVAGHLGIEFDPEVRLNSTTEMPSVALSMGQRRRIALVYEKDIRIFYPSLQALL